MPRPATSASICSGEGLLPKFYRTARRMHADDPQAVGALAAVVPDFSWTELDRTFQDWVLTLEYRSRAKRRASHGAALDARGSSNARPAAAPQLGVVQIARIARHAVAARIAHQAGNLLAADAQFGQAAGDADFAAQPFDPIDELIGRGRIGRLVDADRPGQLDQPSLGHDAIGRSATGSITAQASPCGTLPCTPSAAATPWASPNPELARHMPETRAAWAITSRAPRCAALAHRHGQCRHSRPQDCRGRAIAASAGPAARCSFRSIA